MGMDSLRNKAPEWASNALDELLVLKERTVGADNQPVMMNAIRYGWHRLYLFKVDDPEFQRQAVIDVLARQLARGNPDIETIPPELQDVIVLEQGYHHTDDNSLPDQNPTKKVRKSKITQRCKDAVNAETNMAVLGASVIITNNRIVNKVVGGKRKAAASEDKAAAAPLTAKKELAYMWPIRSRQKKLL